MISELMKIADFLNQSNNKEDADLVDYLENKYASGDLSGFFEKRAHLDIPKEERVILERVLDGLAKVFDKKL